MLTITPSIIFAESFIFILLVLIVFRYIFPKINKIILERQSMIKATISNRKSSEELLLAANQKSAEIINKANQKYREIIEQAKISSDKLYSDAANKHKKQIEIERKKIIEDAHKSIADLKKQEADYVLKNSIKIAQKILARELQKEEHLKIINDITNEIC